jgi:hypothetical protein
MISGKLAPSQRGREERVLWTCMCACMRVFVSIPQYDTQSLLDCIAK